MPYRYYAAKDKNIDQITDYDLEPLPEFEVEFDAIQEGCRHMMLTKAESILNQLTEVGIKEMLQRGKELGGTLAGVEVIHSSDEISISRLRIARHASTHADEIPDDTIILVLESFNNPY